ncbi:hypothetical protein [Noviherbaspirillum sp. Root189]|uniref:hypothetical protein n=1 Tax=Noviherbaspirillum sp. Root189 TaxID=1736487 RepID=UPI000B1860EC|nr:hypothetical protein [Noviherbaspirillum sp. Root189]
MKTYLIAAGLSACAFNTAAETFNFDVDTAGQPPAGWTCGVTGKGSQRWSVEPNTSAPSLPNVLKHEDPATFAWCVRSGISAADGTVRVKFKPVAGREDQAGGLVWRWKNSGTYYIARANALEGNVSLYHMQNGARKTIKYVNAPVAPNSWHVLEVTYKGNAIQVSLDGKAYIEASDSHIPDAGRVGVWTKADSVTLFDDFAYDGLTKQ